MTRAGVRTRASVGVGSFVICNLFEHNYIGCSLKTFGLKLPITTRLGNVSINRIFLRIFFKVCESAFNLDRHY